MDPVTIGALVSTLAIIFFVLGCAIKQAQEIDKERHLKK